MAFYDGASGDSLNKSGGGYVLFLSSNHNFHAKMGFGLGTNNKDELLGWKNLLVFAKEKGCTQLQLYNDSMLIVYWLNRAQFWRNLLLSLILEDIWWPKDSFKLFYIEHNDMVDLL